MSEQQWCINGLISSNFSMKVHENRPRKSLLFFVVKVYETWLKAFSSLTNLPKNVKSSPKYLQIFRFNCLVSQGFFNLEFSVKWGKLHQLFHDSCLKALYCVPVKPSLGCRTGLAKYSRTTDFRLGLSVLVGLRMTGSRQLWAYLKHWLTLILFRTTRVTSAAHHNW